MEASNLTIRVIPTEEQINPQEELWMYQTKTEIQADATGNFIIDGNKAQFPTYIEDGLEAEETYWFVYRCIEYIYTNKAINKAAITISFFEGCDENIITAQLLVGLTDACKNTPQKKAREVEISILVPPKHTVQIANSIKNWQKK